MSFTFHITHFANKMVKRGQEGTGQHHKSMKYE